MMDWSHRAVIGVAAVCTSLNNAACYDGSCPTDGAIKDVTGTCVCPSGTQFEHSGDSAGVCSSLDASVTQLSDSGTRSDDGRPGSSDAAPAEGPELEDGPVNGNSRNVRDASSMREDDSCSRTAGSPCSTENDARAQDLSGDATIAEGGGSPGAQDTDAPTAQPPKTCLQTGSGNYTSPGPYRVAQEDVDLGMIQDGQHTGKFTIYYPNPLETNCLHPIVAWGNGTAVTDSNFTYDFLNSNAASWGMVVASSSEDNTGSGAFHEAGIDYLLKENMDPNSMFYSRLSARAGVSGHSQGGLGAAAASSHPNVEAAVVEGANFGATQNVAALVLAGTDDLGVVGADAVTRATGPMFVAVWEGGNHIGTETVLGFMGLDTTSGDAAQSQKGSQQFQRLYAAWFRCFLADDQAACKLFTGGTPDDCGICKDPGWAQLASKNL